MSVIIIDCLEVFIERPTSFMARAQTWSNYEKHNTIKFLSAITPQGTIGFILNGWGGQASDVYITKHYGLLHHLFHVMLFWLIEVLIFKKQLECTVLKSRFLLTPRGRNKIKRGRCCT